MAERYIVLGAGISGLATAWRLRKKYPDADITLLEKSGRAGGWIETREKEGFLLELGPRSCRARGNGTFTLRLIEELGLQEQVIAADPAAKIRYLYEGGQLRPLPYNLRSFLFSPFLPLIAKGVWKDWITPPQKREDESIFTFACRHFGDEFAERLIDPLTKGIYAGDCRRLSLSSCFPIWKRWEEARGSMIKGAIFQKSKKEQLSPWIRKMQKEPIFTFRYGMETLTRTLAEKLSNSLKLNAAVEKLQFHPHGVEVVLANGETLNANHVYSTLSIDALNEVLNLKVLEPPMQSVALVALGFNNQVLKQKGFGYLIPSREREKILGMVWDSSAFPQQNRRHQETRLTVMIDAEKHREFIAIALDALARHLHIDSQPDVMEVKLAARAIPQYPVGYAACIENAKQRIHNLSPHLTLLGTAFNGVAVNDCIAHAFSTIDEK